MTKHGFYTSFFPQAIMSQFIYSYIGSKYDNKNDKMCLIRLNCTLSISDSKHVIKGQQQNLRADNEKEVWRKETVTT